MGESERHLDHRPAQRVPEIEVGAFREHRLPDGQSTLQASVAAEHQISGNPYLAKTARDLDRRRPNLLVEGFLAYWMSNVTRIGLQRSP